MFFFKKNKIKFNQCIWLNIREKRKLMIDDLIHQKILLNKSKNEILNLLGFEFNDSNSNIWTYYINEKWIFFNSKKYLSIFFDKEGLVYKINYK